METEQQAAPYMTPMDRYGSSIYHMTSTEDEIKKLEETFRGTIYIGNKVISSKEPLMNDEGINSMIGSLQSVVNRITIMSNFDKTDIENIINFYADTVAKDLMLNKRKYGISNNSARDKVYFSLLTVAFSTMKRALEEGDKRFWKGSQHDINTNTNNQVGQGGIIKRLFGWGK